MAQNGVARCGQRCPEKLQVSRASSFCQSAHIDWRGRFLHDEIITVALDGCDHTFAVSKALLCNASDYFDRVLHGGYAESSSRPLRLPRCNEDTFRLLMHWIGTGKLPYGLSSGDEMDSHIEEYLHNVEGDEYKDASLRVQGALVKLWCIADILLMPKLQNEVMKQLIYFLESSYVRPEAVELAFAGSAEDSVLQQLYILEVGYGYGLMSEADKSRLAGVPGFFSKFTRQLLLCPDGVFGNFCMTPECASHARGDETFFVQEM